MFSVLMEIVPFSMVSVIINLLRDVFAGQKLVQTLIVTG